MATKTSKKLKEDILSKVPSIHKESFMLLLEYIDKKIEENKKSSVTTKTIKNK